MQTITNSTALASRYIIAKIAILTCITCQANEENGGAHRNS